MTTNKLRSYFALYMLGMSFFVSAQSADEISKAIEKEDYISARKMCLQLISKDPKSSEGHFFMGETYYENEKSDSAQLYYTKGLTANPDAALCLIGQGKLLLDQNKPAEALKNFEKAAKWTRNKNAYIMYQVGKAYLDQNFAKAYLENTSKYAEQAIEWLDKAIAINPKDGNFFSLLGDAYFFKKDAGTALNKYEFATEKNKADLKNYVKRARINKSAKIFKDAEAILNEALTLDPNYAPALKEMTEVYVASGQYSKVAPILQKYTALAGKDVEARERLVRYLCYYAKDYDAAIKEANNVLAMNPKSNTMYRWLAWAYTYKGKAKDKENPTAAAEDFKKGLEYSKSFIQNIGTTKPIITDYDNYLFCALKTKDFETASQMTSNILELDSTRTDVYETMGKAYFDNKMWEKSAAMYELKMSKAKATTSDYFYIGQCYRKSGNLVKAEQAFTKLKDLSPTYLFAWTQLADIAEIGDPELKTGAALPFHEKVVELAKADEVKNKAQLIKSNYFLGVCNVHFVNDNAKALTYFNEVLRLDPTNVDALAAKSNLEANTPTTGNK
ncbi:MAG: tetratricopeptide repeat protein [Saprospiraceae bacterium]